MNDRDMTYLLKELMRTIDESDSTAAFCLCQRWILKDALALLKEQEAVEPIIMEQIVFGTNRKCSKCNQALFPAGRYCPHCGRPVKWDE